MLARLAPYAVLLTSLVLTGWIWRAAVGSADAIAQLNFQRQIEVFEHRIADRLSDCEHVLLGGAGLAEVKGAVSRSDWQNYFGAIRVEEKLAGVQGLGFSLRIPAAALPGHVREVQAEGFPEYTVRPADPREEYHSIIYLEPFRDRNLRAFGYDMFTESVRRAAMEKARDEGRAIMSGRVTLMQEIPGQPTQPGFLIYMPVYLRGLPRQTVTERQTALRGFVYSPFRAGDFIDRLFFLESHGLAMEIHTGIQGNSTDLLYSSTERPESEKIPAGFQPRYRTTSRIDPLGQRWTLTFTSLPSFEAAQSHGTATVTLAGGLAISLLATGLMMSLNDRSRRLAELSRTSAALQRSRDELEQRVAERTVELELSLRRFRALLEVASDGVHVLDAQGNLQEYSESFRRMLGYDAGEMAARHVTDWDVQIPREKIAEILQKPLGAEMVFETQHRRKDGTVFPVEINAHVIELAGQQRFYASARDITARKRADEELRKSDERLAQAMDQAHLAHWEMDAATSTFTFNDRFYALYGTTAAREGGYQMRAEAYTRDFLPPDEQHLVPRNLSRLLSGEINEFQQEHRVLRRDGELRHIVVRIAVVRDVAGRVIGTRGSNQDVTDLRRAETALRAAAAYARNLLEVNLDALVTISPEGKITDVNEASVRLTGVPREQLIGTDFSNYFTEPAQARAGYQKAFSEGAIRDYPLAIMNVMRHVTDVLYHASVYRDPAGQVLGVLASARDVTLRIREQRKLQELLKQTERDAQTKGELLREVNHRVTNNLTAVLGLLAFETEQARNDPASINRALSRLGQHIRGLLQVHHILSQSAWAPVSMDRLAGDIIRAALSGAPWRQQAVVALPPGTLKVSPRQAGTLAMVINELATNTVKHIGHPIDAVRINFDAESDPEWITLRYRDNGPGYPSEVVENRRANVGLKLIRELVTQTLRGTLTLANDHGAVATLRIRKEEETRT